MQILILNANKKYFGIGELIILKIYKEDKKKGTKTVTLRNARWGMMDRLEKAPSTVTY